MKSLRQIPSEENITDDAMRCAEIAESLKGNPGRIAELERRLAVEEKINNIAGEALERMNIQADSDVAFCERVVNEYVARIAELERQNAALKKAHSEGFVDGKWDGLMPSDNFHLEASWMASSASLAMAALK